MSSDPSDQTALLAGMKTLSTEATYVELLEYFEYLFSYMAAKGFTLLADYATRGIPGLPVDADLPPEGTNATPPDAEDILRKD